VLRAPRRRGPGLPVTTIVLALLSVSTVSAPSSPAASPPAPLPVFTHHAGPGDVVELVGEHDSPPPASMTVVQTTQVPPVTLAPTQTEGVLVPLSAGATPGLPSVPVALLAAYRAAVAGGLVGCHLPVSLLAAIGQVESGSLAGRSVDGHHRAVPGVYGPVLSGGGYAAIHDSDGGSLDGDPRWDRAVGPMQFIPGTWRAFGRDGDADGVEDPQNVFDAAASAAAYLCLGGRDLRDAADLQSAVLSYNHSTAYVDLVLSWQLRLAGGVAEREDTAPASTRPVSTDRVSIPSMPVLPTVVGAAAVQLPLVLVDPTRARPTPAAPGPTLIPSANPVSRPSSTPAQMPAEPGPASAPAVAAGPAVDPPTEPAMVPVMTPTAVTLAPDPPAVVSPTPDLPAGVASPAVVTLPVVLTPTVVVTLPVVLTPTVVDPPVVVTPTVVVTATPDPADCPTMPTAGTPGPVPPSSQPVPPEPAVEAVGCVPAQPLATPSLPVDPPSPGGAVTLPAVPATEPTATG